MKSSDDEFLRELEAAFQIEADEHLQAMSSGLLELEKTPAAPDLLETVFREAHSLKGAARAVNMTDVEAVCQSLETVFAAWKRQEIVPSPPFFDTIHHALDLVSRLLRAGLGGEAAPDKSQISAITHQLSIAIVGARDSQTRPHRSAASSEVVPEAKEPESVEQAPAPPAPPKAAVSETIRISTAKLDTLLRQAEEMLAVKLTAGQRAADLREVQAEVEAALDRWKKECAKLSPALRARRQLLESEEESSAGHPPLLPDQTLELLEWNHAALKSLDSALRRLTRSAEQDHREISGKVDNLLEDTKKLLMLPFSTLLSSFPKMVRDLARDEGKDVQLVMQGGGIEIDKRILEEMKDPLIHLLRNSVDHGIETPDERAKAHKPARATVTIAVSQVSGNEVEIAISDDGAGIDVARVKASAVKHGALSEEAAAQMAEPEALMLIFESEVSTSPIITEISGRGLGMAIVREKAEKLGGRITIDTKRGCGTTFRILLPLTLATFKGILVEAAGQVFVLPTANVECAIRIRAEEVQTVENRETISWKGRLLSLVRLHDVLELPWPETVGDSAEFLPVVVLGTGEKRIAFRVEAILNEQEVLVKTLGTPLLRIRNIAGATILGSGKPVPILNAADLLKSATKLAGAPRAAPVAVAGRDLKRRSILIAEDSITSRMLLKNILESAGYQVTTAVDGLDALAALKTQPFDLIVSDVDMPRMNGFDLTARVRDDKALAETPIVLVTARDTREDRERGVDAGASAYLVKSSFDQSSLLAVIQRLI